MAKSMRSKIKRKFRAIKAVKMTELETERVEKKYASLAETISSGEIAARDDGRKPAMEVEEVAKPFTFNSLAKDIKMADLKVKKRSASVGVTKKIRKGQKATKKVVFHKKDTKKIKSRKN